jgi:hypothetical protein
VNVLVPRPVPLRWSGPNGEDLGHDASLRSETSEKLPDLDGRDHDVHYLSRTVPRVSIRGRHVLHVTLELGERATPRASQGVSSPAEYWTTCAG